MVDRKRCFRRDRATGVFVLVAVLCAQAATTRPARGQQMSRQEIDALVDARLDIAFTTYRNLFAPPQRCSLPGRHPASPRLVGVPVSGAAICHHAPRD